MPRNLDMTALRAFVAVSDAGGVTRAAGFLHLTQSAVSMQIKRLEENLGLSLFDRSGRSLALTSDGEQLLGYAKRILSLNDEVYGRLTSNVHEGEIVLGVPHDIVYPAIPMVLQQFAAEYPRMRVNLLSSFTMKLKEQFARGEADIVLTTEAEPQPGSEVLAQRPLVWIGAIGGHAWRARPLRLGYERNCFFRIPVQRALDKAGIPWEMAVESDSSRTIEATVSADLAVHTVIEGNEWPQSERIAHHGTLPELDIISTNMYVSDLNPSPALEALAELIRQAYRPVSQPSSRRPSPSTPASGATPAHLRPVPTAARG